MNKPNQSDLTPRFPVLQIARGGFLPPLNGLRRSLTACVLMGGSFGGVV